MNTLYFACPACRIYVDAGYRHAYAALEETGIVDRSRAVDVSAVLGARDYWNIEADWLKELLQQWAGFSSCTRNIASHSAIRRRELPRYYVERLGFRAWNEVAGHVRGSNQRPRWWDDERERMAAQQRFTSLVAELPPRKSNTAA